MAIITLVLVVTRGKLCGYNHNSAEIREIMIGGESYGTTNALHLPVQLSTDQKRRVVP